MHILCVVGLHKNKFTGSLKRSDLPVHPRYEASYELQFSCARCGLEQSIDAYKVKNDFVENGYGFEESSIHKSRLFNPVLNEWKY